MFFAGIRLFGGLTEITLKKMKDRTLVEYVLNNERLPQGFHPLLFRWFKFQLQKFVPTAFPMPSFIKGWCSLAPSGHHQIPPRHSH
jgi:hypothetical protein